MVRAFTMVPTCKDVAPYSPASLDVGTMVNAPPCNRLFMPSLHLTFCRIFPLSALFIEHELSYNIYLNRGLGLYFFQQVLDSWSLASIRAWPLLKICTK